MPLISDLFAPINIRGSGAVEFQGNGTIQFEGANLQAAFLDRLKQLLPPWFGNDETPILDGVLAGPAAVLAFVYKLLQYVQFQLRISTATDGFLDLASADFLGATEPREKGEADAAFSARLRSDFFPTRNTRQALEASLTRFGLQASIVEPWNPGDTGVLNNATALAYNTAGVWGSWAMPSQCFVTVNRPSGSTMTNSQIYAVIEGVRPTAVKVWVRIVG